MSLQTIFLIVIVLAFTALSVTLFAIAWLSSRAPAVKPVPRVAPARRPVVTAPLGETIQM
jgi:hypothetical protein